MKPESDRTELGEALRRGGYIILVRHGATFSNQADTDPFNLADITKQRNLNDKGKELAKAFGEAIRAACIPIGEVYASQFNRGYETAKLAGFGNVETTTDLSEGGLVVTPNENNRRAKALRDMLAKTPDEGKDNILITHTRRPTPPPRTEAAKSKKAPDIGGLLARRGDGFLLRPADAFSLLR